MLHTLRDGFGVKVLTSEIDDFSYIKNDHTEDATSLRVKIEAKAHVEVKPRLYPGVFASVPKMGVGVGGPFGSAEVYIKVCASTHCETARSIHFRNQ